MTAASPSDADNHNTADQGALASTVGTADSESLYSSLVENLPICVTRKDLDGRITYANSRFAEVLGLPAEQLIGRTDYDFFPRELAEKYRADDARIMQTGEVFATVEENCADGVNRYFEVRKTPVRDVAGEIVGTQAVFWDVTEKHATARALSRERDQLRALMDHLPSYIFVKDAEAKYVSANRALLRFLGAASEEEVIGRTDFDFAPRELAENYHQDDLEVIRSEEPLVDREESGVDSAGRPIWALTTKVPVRDSSGRVTSLVGISRDITVRRNAAEQLRRAKEAADSANRAKSDFLANMSHEIRTPMNAIIGMTELLLETELDATQREYLSMVQESGESLLAIINDILDFSKVEAGKLELDAAPFGLERCVAAAARSLAVRAHDKGIELAMHIGARVPNGLVGDAVRLRQVIVNLVGNAIKFTEQGEVVLRITVAEQTDTQTTLRFSVADTGIGIPSDKIDRIFDSFSQADTSTTRRYGGTGLGLSISSRIVKLMGGLLTVDSIEGNGSVFSFSATFPLTDADVGTVRNPADITGLIGTRVLVVDDNSTNRRILHDMLRSNGMEPTLASDANAALEEARRARESGEAYPLVLTDLNMPEMDGLTMSRALLEVSEGPAPAVILLTSGDRPADRTRSDELGVYHLMKPVCQSELFETILHSLGLEEFARDTLVDVAAPDVAVRGLRILLAEDAVANQVLAVRLLEKWDHSVEIANDGIEAVQLACEESNRFDVILMDVQMPELDGFEATTRIREIEQEKSFVRTPIVAMTAHALKGDRERCLEVGMDGYVSKPIRVHELLAELSRCVVSGGDQQQLSTGSSPGTGGDATRQPNNGSINWNLANETVQGDRALLVAVVAAFLEEWPQHKLGIRKAIDQQDTKTAKRLSHLVRGVMISLGGEKAQEIAAELETAAAAGDMVTFAGLHEDFEKVMHDVETELASFIQ